MGRTKVSSDNLPKVEYKQHTIEIIRFSGSHSQGGNNRNSQGARASFLLPHMGISNIYLPIKCT